VHDLVAAIEDHVRLPAFNVPPWLTTTTTPQDEIDGIGRDVRRHFLLSLGPVDHLPWRGALT
jgi:hypothetical protein